MRDDAQHLADDAQHRATEFVKELYVAGDIDAGPLDASVTEILAATTEAELAEVVRSLPPPIALTSADRRLSKPLEMHSGTGRLRVAGRWQVGKETVPALPLIRLDLTTNIGRIRLRHPKLSAPSQPRSRPAVRSRLAIRRRLASQPSKGVPE